MKKLNTISYDSLRDDYLIDGKPFLQHLKTHEDISPFRHMPAVLSQKSACDRLLGMAEADLNAGHVAIYLCCMCGGYDGNPIGVKVVIDDESIAWKDIGLYYDYDDAEDSPFYKVRECIFDKDEYIKAIEKMRLYGPTET